MSSSIRYGGKNRCGSFNGGFREGGHGVPLIAIAWVAGVFVYYSLRYVVGYAWARFLLRTIVENIRRGWVDLIYQSHLSEEPRRGFFPAKYFARVRQCQTFLGACDSDKTISPFLLHFTTIVALFDRYPTR